MFGFVVDYEDVRKAMARSGPAPTASPAERRLWSQLAKLAALRGEYATELAWVFAENPWSYDSERVDALKQQIDGAHTRYHSTLSEITGVPSWELELHALASS